MEQQLLQELNEINTNVDRTIIEHQQAGVSENTLLDALNKISSDKKSFDVYSTAKPHERIIGKIKL